MSEPEAQFLLLWKSVRGQTPQQEFRFHPERLWRFDFAWPAAKMAVEIEGGSWSGGRHSRGKGFAADCEKYNAAAMAGWRVIRLTPAMIDRETLLLIKGAL